jgi:long-chain fatty acid transport protein
MNRTLILLGSLISGLFLLVIDVGAAGFALQEQSVSGLGNAFAGGAAAMEDNSAIFTNPAALIGIETPQLQLGVHRIAPESEFNNENTTTFGFSTKGSEGESDKAAFVPNLYYSQPVNDSWVLGLSVSVPFGLTTEWGDEWVGRYIADRSKIEDINIQPTLAFKVNDNLSIGAGLDIAMVSAELTNAVDMGLVFLQAIQQGNIPMSGVTYTFLADVQNDIGGSKYDGSFKVKGDGIGYGYNVGILYRFNEQTRLGIHYRASIDVDLEGDNTFVMGALEPYLASVFPNGQVSVDLKLPSTSNVSLFHQINDSWSIMGDIQYTTWSSFDYLNIQYKQPTPPTTSIPELWEDVWRYAVGTNYQVNDALKLRAGVSFEETPIPDSGHRSPRIPDADRIWYTVGMEYAFNDSVRINAGLALITVDDPKINNNTHSAGQHLIGTIDASVTILSLSMVYDF